MLTVGWNVVEAGVAVWAALAAGSVALLGFGFDSVVESASGAVLLWRLGAERRAGRDGALDLAAVERLDRQAHRLVGVSLFLLAGFVAFDAVRTLVVAARPEVSYVGIGANALFGWWWADPLAALAFTPLLIHEGREGWRGEDCGC